MRKIVLVYISITISTLLQAQKSFSKDQQEVQQTIIQFFDALSNRDSVRLKSNCTADITLLETGSIWNLDTLILKGISLNTTPDFKRTNRINFISTTVTGKTAWATYNLYSEVSRNGKLATIQWMETVVAVKEKNTWKINLLHSTLIKRN